MAGREIIVRILGDADSFDKATKQAVSSADKFSNVLKGIGTGIGIGVANMAGNAAAAVGSFMQGSIEAASNLNETMTKSAVIFGDGIAAVEDWAAAASSSMGLSQRAALDAASGFAGLFKTVGIGLDQATEMSTKITALGADLASFFNTDMQSALDALQSGIAGESEPLRQFNVFLSEAAVSAKLAEMGIKKTGGAFTEAQKATGRYALILQQTGDAQGDFARTSDGLANSQRTLDAKMEDLQARLGQSVLPIIVTVTGAAVELFDVLGGKGFAQDFVPSTYQAKDAVQSLGDAIGNALDFLTPWDGYASAARDRMNELGPAATQAALEWDTGSERIREALNTVATASDTTTTAVKKDNRKIVTSYAEVAAYLLGEYNTNYDTALGIQETRSALHKAKTDADRAAAYADLQSYGALSQKDYDAWATAVERMAKGTKGAVHDAYEAAIRDIRALQAAASRPVNVDVHYRSVSGPAGEAQPRASGGPASGLTLVGEKGAELVDLPNGSYVYNAKTSERMLRIMEILKKAKRAATPVAPPAADRGMTWDAQGRLSYLPTPAPPPEPVATTAPRSAADILGRYAKTEDAAPFSPFDTAPRSITIYANITFTGPTLDPYGDFAQRLAAALVPGLQRELARQGINL